MSFAKCIAIVGPDGTGKSWQVRELAESLRELRGGTVISTRNPGGSVAAEKIREVIMDDGLAHDDALTDSLLFIAAARASMLDTVEPNLQAGHTVVMDRFGLWCGQVYQSIRGRTDEERADIAHHYRTLHMEYVRRVPCVTILLDLPAEEAMRRLRGRDGTGNRYDSASGARAELLRRGYLALAHANPKLFRVVPAAGSKEAVAARVMDAVAEGAFADPAEWPSAPRPDDGLRALPPEDPPEPKFHDHL